MYNYLFSFPTLTNCTFTDNTANYGGGMFNDDSSPTLTDCTFTDNTANYGGGMRNVDNAGLGGGMHNYNSDPTLTDCTFTNNTTDGKGGGMYNHLFSSPTLTNCTFTYNTTVDDGGGMYNYVDSSPHLIDCIFENNIANGKGGGMLNIINSNPTLTDTTVCGKRWLISVKAAYSLSSSQVGARYTNSPRNVKILSGYRECQTKHCRHTSFAIPDSNAASDQPPRASCRDLQHFLNHGHVVVRAWRSSMLLKTLLHLHSGIETVVGLPSRPLLASTTILCAASGSLYQRVYSMRYICHLVEQGFEIFRWDERFGFVIRTDVLPNLFGCLSRSFRGLAGFLNNLLIFWVTSGVPCTADGLFYGELQGGGDTFTWEVPLDASGDIPYFCEPHCSMGMTGLIAGRA